MGSAEQLVIGPSAVLDQKPIKCIVWDLDHTLWDGVLSEGDEIKLKPGIVELIKRLDQRGILHSVASKNNFDDAFEKLQALGIAEYFLYPKISWSPKSLAVEEIRTDLNIGKDSFLFIDDQPFEREEVKMAHSEVECIDASEYALLEQHPRIAGFEVSDDAAQRRIRYQEDMQRKSEESEFVGTPEAFLATLGMQFSITKAKEEDLLRAEELTVRTNQLNSTGITYSYEDLKNFMSSDRHELFVCELNDKFGSYGKIGLVLLEFTSDSMLVKLLLMSCRVAARGVGGVLLTYLVKKARAQNMALLAEFRRTPRNRQMLVTYQFSGFKEVYRGEDGNIIFEHDPTVPANYPDYIELVTE